ncbi:MAG TPA: hypothetical protein DCL43_10730 [Chitinophagaceae bacterium]|nr:hypothetical protein [Chitinophagaceae bacterium]HAN38003.1 hypothetical protein [Chitinophagaceae bacterium]
MKRLLMLVALILGINATHAQIQTATLKASGLTCSMCSKAVYDALTKVDFVKSVKANIQKSEYTIQLDDTKKIELSQLAEAVEDAGFSVAEMFITTKLSNLTVKNDAHIEMNGALLHFVNVPTTTVDGMVTLRLLDKVFAGDKTHKKYAQYTAMECYNTGYEATCCNTKSNGTKARMYHVTL